MTLENQNPEENIQPTENSASENIANDVDQSNTEAIQTAEAGIVTSTNANEIDETVNLIVATDESVTLTETPTPTIASDDEAEDITEHDEHVSETDDVHFYSPEEFIVWTNEKLIAEYEAATLTEPLTKDLRNKIMAFEKAIIHQFEEYVKAETDKNHSEETDAEAAQTAEVSAIIHPAEEVFKNIRATYRKRLRKDAKEAEKAREENLSIKNGLIDALRSLIEKAEDKNTWSQITEIQKKWKATGPVPKEQAEDVYKRFTTLIDKCYEALKISRELMVLDMQKNLEHKVHICEKAESLLNEPSLQKSIEQLNLLHEEWKEVGPVTKEKREEIWNRFKAATDRIYDKRNEFFKIQNEEREQNQVLKQALIVKVSELIAATPKTHAEWSQLTTQVLEIQAEWKKVGFAPKAVNNEIWDKFKGICDDFFTTKNNFYKALRADQTQVIKTKTALCEQAEALLKSEDWKKTTNEFIRLQNEWKASGALSKKLSDKLWKRFRAACDAFFSAKQVHFSNQDHNQEANLNAKIALIEQIEQFQLSDNANNDIDALKEYQRQWLEIGFVPIKEKQQIQDRYRNAINQHFDSLKLNQVEKQRMKYHSRLESISHGDDAERTLKKEHRELMQRISKIQSDIDLWENNIEFLSQSKNADTLRREIEAKIGKAKEEIVNLQEKLKMVKSY